MGQKIIMTVLKSIVSYIVLLILGRSMGRKMISRITFFDFLIGITLGSLAVRMSLGNESSMLMTVISSVVITSLALITDMLNLKWDLFRKIEEGEPIVLMRKGTLIYKNFVKAKISISKFLMLLRQKEVFDIKDVDYAIFENDGHLSVLLKSQNLPATSGELKISKSENKLSIDVILDGKIIIRNLEACQHTKEWLLQQLKTQGAARPDQVFYASVNKNDELFVAPYLQQ